VDRGEARDIEEKPMTMAVARQRVDPHNDFNWSTPADSDSDGDGAHVGADEPMTDRAVPSLGVAVLGVAVGVSLYVAARNFWTTLR